jgi:hypothetical protein
MNTDDQASAKYYYNLKTGEVEQGMLTGAPDRMGPYDTREEAQAAMAKAEDRNEAWVAAAEEEAEQAKDAYDRAEEEWQRSHKDEFDLADEAWKDAWK